MQKSIQREPVALLRGRYGPWVSRWLLLKDWFCSRSMLSWVAHNYRSYSSQSIGGQKNVCLHVLCGIARISIDGLTSLVRTYRNWSYHEEKYGLSKCVLVKHGDDCAGDARR